MSGIRKLKSIPECLKGISGSHLLALITINISQEFHCCNLYLGANWQSCLIPLGEYINHKKWHTVLDQNMRYFVNRPSLNF